MTGRPADRFTCGRRARMAASLGERGRSSGVGVGSSERVRRTRRVDGTGRLARGDIETDDRGPAANSRGREEMTDRAVQRVDARAALAGVGLDVRRGMGARGVEAGVGPRSGPGQQELEQRAEPPEGARPQGAPGHPGGGTSVRTTTAPSNTIPYSTPSNRRVGRGTP